MGGGRGEGGREIRVEMEERGEGEVVREQRGERKGGIGEKKRDGW